MFVYPRLLWVYFIKFLPPNGTYILNEWVRHTTNFADSVSDGSLNTLTFCRCIILEELMEAILSFRTCTISSTIPQVLDRTDVVLEVGDRVVAIWRLYVADITCLEWVGNLGCTYLVRDTPSRTFLHREKLLNGCLQRSELTNRSVTCILHVGSV